MATIFVYNNSDGGVERYTRALGDPMPYNTNNTLCVADFLGDNETGWTDLATMQAWNGFCTYYGQPVKIARAFVSVAQWKAQPLTAPQHLAGTAFALRATGTPQGREALAAAAKASDAFSVVHPCHAGDGTLCVDRRYQPSGVFATAGFPILHRDSCGNYVLTLQALLRDTGHRNVTSDGVFGAQTERALRAYQRSCRLPENGIAGRMEWESLVAMRYAESPNQQVD